MSKKVNRLAGLLPVGSPKDTGGCWGSMAPISIYKSLLPLPMTFLEKQMTIIIFSLETMLEENPYLKYTTNIEFCNLRIFVFQLNR